MNAEDYNRITKTTEVFLQAIPSNPAENIAFRKDLHLFLFKDEQARANYLAHCFIDPVVFFNSALSFPNPRGKSGYRTVPAILYPHQMPAIRKIKRAIDEGFDVSIDKSRDQGATFLLIGITVLYWLIQEGFTVLLGSRVEDLVDKSSEIVNGEVIGPEITLFYKILYLINSLPVYLQPPIKKSHMFIQHLVNGSSYTGQATQMGFGKGSRATVIGVDELAAIEPKIAQAIIENIADVSGCCIFNSTQGDWGEAHPYAKMLNDPRVEKIILDWTSDPRKNQGLYKSEREGEVTVYDVEYYLKNHPGLLEKYGRPTTN